MMRMPCFTAEASLGTTTRRYMNRRVAPTRVTNSAVVPAWQLLSDLSDHGGPCVSYCDVFGCIWCCHGACDPEYH